MSMDLLSIMEDLLARYVLPEQCAGPISEVHPER